MACALQYIHSENIIHGDLNPNNVLLKSALTPSVQSHKSSAEANSLKVYSDLGKGFSVKVRVLLQCGDFVFEIELNISGILCSCGYRCVSINGTPLHQNPVETGRVSGDGPLLID